MKVLLVGGTGFVGHHIVGKLLGQGHQVSVLARTPSEHLPAGAVFHAGDANRLSDEDLTELLAGHDGVVHAATAAFASPLNVDTAAFFRASNVEPVVRLLAAARRAGCDRSALLGSFYATLHRERPEARVHEGSPYIHSRIEQASWARSAAGDAMSLAVLELPYVLGHTPGRWSALAPHLEKMAQGKGIAVYPGGTAVAAVSEVADAAVIALEQRANGDFPIATANISWKHLLRGLAVGGGHAPRRVWELSPWETEMYFRLQLLQMRKGGVRSGFHPARLGRLHASDMFVDTDIATKALGFEHADVDQAIRDTARD
ncbi:NAD(P)-dependent oxidoreductase [Kutzneria sp. 744]|uniref:NAD-dependent epimerase/dehydratase family protein n=1 Tax=Kutzneria sp. (strain 744) TaxID=345341 RepID=UPI0003EEDAAA|nr:NAD-dependent epimerase/dehydratase family protein [Kutzneria sp. 744]EWM18443.1 PE-PGRS family protein [Kutzneria sp. 744]